MRWNEDENNGKTIILIKKCNIVNEKMGGIVMWCI